MYRNVHTQQTTVGPLCVEVRKLEVDTVRWGVWYAVRWGVWYAVRWGVWYAVRWGVWDTL